MKFFYTYYIYTIKNIEGNEQPKYAPSTSGHFFFGMYTSSHLGQNTLTLEVRNSSLIPTGRTFYLSHKTLGQAPNLPATYFSFIIAKP